MKTARRHELQHNVLAAWINEKIQAIRPYATLIGLGLAGIAILLVVWAVGSERSRARQEDGWKRYYALTSMTYRIKKLQEQDAVLNPPGTQPAERRQLTQEQRDEVALEINSDIANLVDEFAGTPVAWSATLHLADFHRDAGIRRLFQSDRLAADTQLDGAVEAYQTILKEAKDPLLLARAKYALAQTLEARRRRPEKAEEEDDIKLAMAHYAALADASDEYDKVYAKLASARLAALEHGDFYEWFDKSLDFGRPATSGFPNFSTPFSRLGDDTPGSDLMPRFFDDSPPGENPALPPPKGGGESASPPSN